ncbi:hypothetical protein LTSEURB_6728 [Salmonella enterica subsp. enterica serovar Urbana str. R8-2977]|nr:hypothetical protein LTSEURB_6728 [Salmonella enterica subsp. enterica serovar Urbana str. R8-2977]
MYFKISKFIHECNLKKEDKKKCINDISSEYQKRVKKYRELKTLMSESSRYN